MAESLNEHEVRKYLDAFADGELDVEQNLRVLEHMAMNPTTTRRVMHQQQLHQAVKRALDQDTPVVPDSLRKRIEQLAQTVTLDADQGDRFRSDATQQAMGGGRSVLARIGRWVPLIAAAVFFISALAVLSVANKSGSTISDTNYIRFVSRHTICSRKIEKLARVELFPQNIEELPPALAQFLGGPAAMGLDLSSLGYEFQAVGECNVPGDKSVHLIYRAKDDPTGDDTLSLWIRRFAGSPDISSDRFYAVAGSDAANPLIFWRQGGMIYYLVGNSFDRVDSAAKRIRTTG